MALENKSLRSLCSLTAALACSGLLAASASAEVIGDYQFNTVGDTEGWVILNNIDDPPGLVADGDSLNGTATNGDPQLGLDPAGLQTTGTWDQVEFRVRELGDLVESGSSQVVIDPGPTVVPFDPIGVLVRLVGPNGGANFSNLIAVDSGDGFYTVSVDISDFGSDDITSIRLDPIGGAAGNSNSNTADNTFEIDYIRVTDIPEPGSLALLAIGGLAMLRRRR